MSGPQNDRTGRSRTTSTRDLMRWAAENGQPLIIEEPNGRRIRVDPPGQPPPQSNNPCDETLD